MSSGGISNSLAISSIRNRHSLGDKDGLLKDLLPQLFFQGRFGDQIYPAPDNALDELFQIQELKKSRSGTITDQDVYVAFLTGGTPADGAENRQRFNREPVADLVFVAALRFDYGIVGGEHWRVLPAG